MGERESRKGNERKRIQKRQKNKTQIKIKRVK
jgi:hypothetical protein